MSAPAAGARNQEPAGDVRHKRQGNEGVYGEVQYPPAGPGGCGQVWPEARAGGCAGRTGVLTKWLVNFDRTVPRAALAPPRRAVLVPFFDGLPLRLLA